MSSFINNLVDRSIAPATGIKPRLRGKFERVSMPSESFSGTEGFASNVIEASQSKVETITPQKTELVRRIQVTKLVEKLAEEIAPSPANRASQKDPERSIPGTKSERPPRFEPSYNLVARGQNQQQDSSEKTAANISNADQQGKKQSADRVDNADNENKQHQVSLYQSGISPTSTIITTEVYKTLPLVKPTANSSSRVESPQKASLKQSPVNSLINRQTVKPEPSRTINISIDRIEVRLSQPPVIAPAKPGKDGVAIMGLDEYLQKRNQRRQ